jgi:hypothetical protein
MKKKMVAKGLPLPQHHKEAISRGMKRYYTTHDVPWKGQLRSDEFKNKVSEGLKRAYDNGLTNWNANIKLSKSHKANISKSLIKTWKNKDKKPRAKSIRNKISKGLKRYWKDKNKKSKNVID